MIYGKPNEGKFFKFNNEHRYIPEIAALIKEYGEDNVDTWMWAIYIMYHPDSSIYNMSRDDQEEWILNWMEVESFDFEIWDDVIKVFPKFSMTPEAAIYYETQELYRQSVVDAKSMNAKDRITFMASTDKIARNIENLRNAYILTKDQSEAAQGEKQSGWGSKHKGRKSI